MIRPQFDIEDVIGREGDLFVDVIKRHAQDLDRAVLNSRILVYGGAGSIGKEVARQLFARRPAVLHVMDISENNLVELVRDLRSSLGYFNGETRFLPLDMGSPEAAAFVESEPAYDYVFNLAAMKHVRSEKDEFSLMRMIKTNVLDTCETLDRALRDGTSRYFAVSSDKAKNPANLMGATKRIMEDVLFSFDQSMIVSTARFANVAFSDGSLLHGFLNRIRSRHPLSAPRDVRRYFVTGDEAGRLCLSSAIMGHSGEIFFPKLDEDADLLTFSEIARRLLESLGYEPVEVESEEAARRDGPSMIASGRWPCYFFDSDTSGEKPFEEFYSADDAVDLDRYRDIGVIRTPHLDDSVRRRTSEFLETIKGLRRQTRWSKGDLLAAIHVACPDLNHIEKGRSLDNRM